MVKSLSVLVLAFGLATPAAAKDKPPVDPNKRICRSEIPTGSRFAKSTCHTLAEWRAIDGADQRDADRFRDQSVQQSVGTR